MSNPSLSELLFRDGAAAIAWAQGATHGKPSGTSAHGSYLASCERMVYFSVIIIALLSARMGSARKRSIPMVLVWYTLTSPFQLIKTILRICFKTFVSFAFICFLLYGALDGSVIPHVEATQRLLELVLLLKEAFQPLVEKLWPFAKSLSSDVAETDMYQFIRHGDAKLVVTPTLLEGALFRQVSFPSLFHLEGHILIPISHSPIVVFRAKCQIGFGARFM